MLTACKSGRERRNARSVIETPRLPDLQANCFLAGFEAVLRLREVNDATFQRPLVCWLSRVVGIASQQQAEDCHTEEVGNGLAEHAGRNCGGDKLLPAL